MQIRANCNRDSGGQRGFTLIEMMVVVAIVGIASGLAFLYVDSGRKGKAAEGFAESLGVQYELARARASASQKRQRIVIEPQRFTHWQSKITGLAASTDPNNYTTDWDFVYASKSDPSVKMWAIRSSLEHEPIAAPSEDTSLFFVIYVLPDGRARSDGSLNFFESGWTVYITDGKNNVRTLLFAVTGTSITYNSW